MLIIVPYAFRIRFHVEPTHSFDSDLAETQLPDGPVLAAVKDATFKTTDRLKLMRTGYDTEECARKDGERWFDAILVAGLRLRTGLDLGRFRSRGGLTDYGIAYLSREFRKPVQDSIHGLDVYEDTGQTFVSL